MKRIMQSLLQVVLILAVVSMPVKAMDNKINEVTIKVQDFLNSYSVLGYRVLSATKYEDSLYAKSSFKAFLDRSEQLYVSAQLLDESIALGRRLLACSNYEEEKVVQKDFEAFWLKSFANPKL